MCFLWQKIEAFEHRLYTHPLHKDPRLEDLYSSFEKKTQVSFTHVKMGI